mmetsp:Transcript_18623/g.51064  ORF Transcript_18623/g.51064 Transcript_18623/m.51064 type:complete len:233 (+) Transcript_18623:447-1145(+)
MALSSRRSHPWTRPRKNPRAFKSSATPILPQVRGFNRSKRITPAHVFLPSPPSFHLRPCFAALRQRELSCLLSPRQQLSPLRRLRPRPMARTCPLAASCRTRPLLVVAYTALATLARLGRSFTTPRTRQAARRLSQPPLQLWLHQVFLPPQAAHVPRACPPSARTRIFQANAAGAASTRRVVVQMVLIVNSATSTTTSGRGTGRKRGIAAGRMVLSLRALMSRRQAQAWRPS